MRKVMWPSNSATHAEVWRVLDLAGFTTSIRDSRNFVLSGYVYVDHVPVFRLTDRVEIGKQFLLEIRFPNGVTLQDVVFLTRPVRFRARNPVPYKEYRKR